MNVSRDSKSMLTKISTNRSWKNLKQKPSEILQIRELETWLNDNNSLALQHGKTALFAGPSGTGKTLSAELLGKYTQHDVYRIDLSMLVSKYIGETEKNIDRIFSKAAHKDWILFFDEADAIFGKRTNVRDAHDKYANMETSYLLRSIEKYHGLVILSCNSTKNVSEAVRDSFDTVIEFSQQSFTSRVLAWFVSLFNKA